jgi:heme-degrading monooxygenase HmoA
MSELSTEGMTTSAHWVTSSLLFGRMIVEHATLPVQPGQELAFEAAFGEAKSIIASMPGFGGLTLSRCLERPSTYLLLVEWDTLTDHTEGFRGSPEYQQWRALLHHFYDPFPDVEHFERVHTA